MKTTPKIKRTAAGSYTVGEGEHAVDIYSPEAGTWKVSGVDREGELYSFTVEHYSEAKQYAKEAYVEATTTPSI